MKRRALLLAAMLLSLALAGLVFSQIRVRSDLTALLPAAGDRTARLMTEELRTGTAASLLMIGLEGRDVASLGSLSDRLTARLSADPQFRFAQNGRDLLAPQVIATLFADRYLLAPMPPDAFSVAALRADFIRLRQGLESAASPLVQRFGMPDPTGALPALLATWQGGGGATLRDGVWFAAGTGPTRALLIARMRAGGGDQAGQARALEAVRADFAALHPHARLLLTGVPVFAEAAARAVQSDVRLLSVASLVLVTGWLVWRFRSAWMLAAIAVSVPLSLSAAALAVQAAFGFVHAITLGFGMVMLGVTVDYPVLLVGHRKRGEPAPGTIRRIRSAFTLSVLTASLGLSGMAGSSFPGVAQLGLFAVTGILTAAAVTRWLLPPLIEWAGIAPAYAGDPVLLQRVETMRSWRLLGLLPVAVAIIIIIVQPPRLDRDLAGLAPVPPALLALDRQLRDQLGAPTIGQLALVSGASRQAVLQAEEAAGPLDGFEAASHLLPSIAAQRARQQALPDAATLSARIDAAAHGLGFTATAFARFAHDVAAARAQAPLTEADLPSILLRTRLDSLLFRQHGTWYGAVIPRQATDEARLAARFAHRPGWRFIDVRATTERVVAGYTSQAWPYFAAGAVAATLLLFLGQRDPWRTARVLGAIAATLLVSVAILDLRRGSLSLIHLVALQFVGGIGLDYALFFARTQLDAEERARTMRTLITCNVMALLTFSLLCLCHTPLLRQIGATVSIGVVLAFGFAFLFAGPAPTNHEHT